MGYAYVGLHEKDKYNKPGNIKGTLYYLDKFYAGWYAQLRPIPYKASLLKKNQYPVNYVQRSKWHMRLDSEQWIEKISKVLFERDIVTSKKVDYLDSIYYCTFTFSNETKSLVGKGDELYKASYNAIINILRQLNT